MLAQLKTVILIKEATQLAFFRHWTEEVCPSQSRLFTVGVETGVLRVL